MREGAALAGVSFKTVSRVVNSESGVSPGLEARVRRAIERLGYQPNVSASGLRRRNGRTGSIGMLVPDLSNPFSATVHRAVDQTARERAAMVFAVSCDEDPDRERDALAAFAGRRVDGIIVMLEPRPRTSPMPVTGPRCRRREFRPTPRWRPVTSWSPCRP
jgi:LacI family transcriptional regulator, galactose operon repressor